MENKKKIVTLKLTEFECFLLWNGLRCLEITIDKEGDKRCDDYDC